MSILNLCAAMVGNTLENLRGILLSYHDENEVPYNSWLHFNPLFNISTGKLKADVDDIELLKILASSSSSLTISILKAVTPYITDKNKPRFSTVLNSCLSLPGKNSELFLKEFIKLGFNIDTNDGEFNPIESTFILSFTAMRFDLETCLSTNPFAVLKGRQQVAAASKKCLELLLLNSSANVLDQVISSGIYSNLGEYWHDKYYITPSTTVRKLFSIQELCSTINIPHDIMTRAKQSQSIERK